MSHSSRVFPWLALYLAWVTRIGAFFGGYTDFDPPNRLYRLRRVILKYIWSVVVVTEVKVIVIVQMLQLVCFDRIANDMFNVSSLTPALTGETQG